MVALGLAVFAAGCGAATASEGVVPVDVGVSPLSSAATRAAPQPPEELEDVLSGLSAFGFELYQGMKSDRQNLVLSPLSIASTLALASAGAAPETEQDILRALGSEHPEPMRATMNYLDLAIESSNDADGVEVESANSVWVQEGFRVEQAFVDLAAEFYGSDVYNVDFGGKAEEQVGSWINQKTRGRIDSATPPPSETKVELVNTVYMNASWLAAFSEDETDTESFYLLDGDTVRVPLMSANSVHGRYTKTSDYEAVAIPYSGEELAMYIVLPSTGSFALVEARMNQEFFQTLREDLAATVIDSLLIPRWDFASDSDRLEPILKELGVPIPGGSYPRIAPGLFASKIVHRANITVDEKGTEAAAATEMFFEVSSSLDGPSPLIFRADRPFLFAVVHEPTGAILFLGRVMDPSMH
jgi:serpin B